MIGTREQLLRHLDRGGVVACEKRNEPEPKIIWSVPLTGETVHASAMQWALKEGRVRPRADGLFPETAQTFVGA